MSTTDHGAPRTTTGGTAQPLFDQIGDHSYLATDASRGPWDPAHCHGGPVAALLTRAVERHDTGAVTWQLARVTIELIRPVPVGRPLHLSVETERPGRRVSLVAATLVDPTGGVDGTSVEVARVRGLRIRDTDLPLPPGTPLPQDRFPLPPEESRLEPMRSQVAGEPLVTSFATTSCEHRFASGSWIEPGPVDVWIRLRVPVVAGEEPSGAQRAAAAADFGNGVSAALGWDDHLFINPDLTVHLVRPPSGEWIGLRAVTHLASRGLGLAESALHDVTGPVGRSVQSLYLDRR